MGDAPLVRFARYDLDGRSRFARLLAGGDAELLTDAPWAGGRPTGELLRGVDEEGRAPDRRRLTPVAPSKIVCVGRNYPAHARERGNDVPSEPLLFLKPPSSLLEPDGVLELPLPSVSTRVEHEAELGVVIGRRARHVSVANAPSFVFGLTAVVDVTARDLQDKDGQWTRAKGMDGFCPAGPVVVAGLDPKALAIRCSVNGELRQTGSTSEMVFDVAAVIAYASRFMTLEPGDLLAMGTPPGVGPLRANDTLDVAIEHIGTLSLRVVDAPTAP